MQIKHFNAKLVTRSTQHYLLAASKNMITYSGIPPSIRNKHDGVAFARYLYGKLESANKDRRDMLETKLYQRSDLFKKNKTILNGIKEKLKNILMSTML